jgi:hypothetical protein
MISSSITSSRRMVVAFVGLVVVVGALWLSRPASAQVDVHVFLPANSRYEFLDFGTSGLRLGDRLAARAPLLDATQTSQVGSSYAECVVMRHITDVPGEPSGGLYRCSYLLRLADGDLVLDGLDPHGLGVYTMAVLGGTGAYAGASGDATLTDTFEGTEFVIQLAG